MKAWSGLCWIYLLHTSYSEFALLQKVFPLYTDLQLLFMTFFYEANPRGKLLCLCSVHLPITRVRLSFLRLFHVLAKQNITVRLCFLEKHFSLEMIKVVI